MYYLLPLGLAGLATSGIPLAATSTKTKKLCVIFGKPGYFYPLIFLILNNNHGMVWVERDLKTHLVPTLMR